MSLRLHILSPGFTSPNGRAFLFPLKVWRRQLAEAGIQLRLFTTRDPGLVDCDVLGIDSRFYSPHWASKSAAVMDELAALAAGGPRLLWFDTTDSSGWDHARVLPLVDKLVKNQVLRDRRLYLSPLYGGGRLFADHYHRTRGVEDAAPLLSEPVADPALLDKLCVGWNSGLADYSLWGPARMAAYHRLPASMLLRFPAPFAAPRASRPINVAARFGTRYARASVAFQRGEIARLLAGHLPTDKLRRQAYLREMTAARLVVSPFGLGEITLKDFEVFLAGATLLKPAMDHMETWPDLFRAGETMLSHSWQLDDLPAVIEQALADPEACRAIAARGQELYRRHTTGQDAANLFVTHLRGIVTTKHCMAP